jgi:glycosyltransferase involved in cell wall biosynthesis
MRGENLKILFCSPFRDGTGYSKAGIEYIMSMDAVGLEVVPRCIKLNSYIDRDVPQRILELEQKDEQNCNICVQHILPSIMEYNGNFTKNIGLFAWETSSFTKSNWVEHLNLMNEIWTISRYQAIACQNSGVLSNLRIIPHAVNLEKFDSSYEKPKELEQCLQSDFIFYTIGEFTRRKNFTALLKAFYLEFDPVEPVQLVIKTTQNLDDFINRTAAGLKLYGNLKYYKKPIVITRRFSDNEIYGLHYHSNCYISTSYGEACCLPILDAIGFGKTPISPDNTGYNNYNSNLVGWTVPCTETNVFGMVESLPELYSGNEIWYEISVTELQRAMREAYQNEKLKREKSEAGVKYIQRFSHFNIGTLIKNILNVET